jgi:hypothetical protein
MKLQSWKASVVLAMTVVLVLSQLRGASAKAEDWDSDGKRLEGTWVVTVTLQNCATKAQIGNPFQSLLTFARGGTMTETTSNSMFFPALRSPGHGVWKRTGRETYKASSLAFITLNGVLVKTQKISQVIEMEDDPDSFNTTEASVQFFDPSGNLLTTGCAVAKGKRFE